MEDDFWVKSAIVSRICAYEALAGHTRGRKHAQSLLGGKGGEVDV
jgi:hypothetical protein